MHIKGFHRVALGKPAWESTFETFYSREFLEKIIETKKEWLKCEIDRSERPDYLEQPLKSHFRRLGVDLGDKTILDFGCGAGASSVILCRLGGKKIIGVDCAKGELEIARLRARDCALTDRLEFLYVAPTHELPFKSESFAVVFCNGVLEHIPPTERSRYVVELWRLLAPGGYLFVHETPNRLWPIDDHTTGLPLVPYLPLRLARQFAIRCSKKVRSDASLGDLIAAGMRGCTYWQILHPIRNQKPSLLNQIVGNDIEMYFEISLARGPSALKKVALLSLRTLYQILRHVVLRPLHLPPSAFLPWLTICLQKQVTKT